MPPEHLLSTAVDDAVSDAELIVQVRNGDSAAYDALYLRHREVARRLARRLADAERADDLVAESFARILDLLRRDKGPDIAFRAYLLTTVRTIHLNQVRRSREAATEDQDLEFLSTPVADDPDARFDETAIARAFRELPERWQSALWLTAVEGRSNEEVSRHLGIRSNAVSSLAFRARAGLRQAYLAEHLRRTADVECARITEQLPSYLRGSLTPRRRGLVDAHLDRCSRCSVAAAELADVDRRLGALLAPAVLGPAAVALWPATVGIPAGSVFGGVLAGHGAAAPGFVGFLSRGTDLVRSAGVGSAAAAVVIAGAAAFPGPDTARSADSSDQVSLGDQSVVAAPRPRPVVATPTRPPAETVARATPTTTPPPPAKSKPKARQIAPAPTAPVTPPGPSTLPPVSSAITSFTAQADQHGQSTWYHLTVSTSGVVKGTTVRFTSEHTTGIHVTGTATRDWSCASPETTDGMTALTCTYDRRSNGTDGSLSLDYEIDAPTTVTATLGPSEKTVTLG